MAPNSTHIQTQPDRSTQQLNVEQSEPVPVAATSAPHQQYLFECTLPSGEQMVVKCTATPFLIGSNSNICDLILPEFGIESKHLAVQFTVDDQVLVHNHSTQPIQQVGQRVYIDGRSHGENRRRVGFKKRRYKDNVDATIEERSVQHIDEPQEKQVDNQIEIIIPPNTEQAWQVGASLFFQQHILTLYKTAQFSDSSQFTPQPVFERFERRVLPSVQLRNRQFGGIYLRQIFGAWWIFALLFIGGGIIGGGLSIYTVTRLLTRFGKYLPN